jgi:hypothetical protein
VISYVRLDLPDTPVCQDEGGRCSAPPPALEQPHHTHRCGNCSDFPLSIVRFVHETDGDWAAGYGATHAVAEMQHFRALTETLIVMLSLPFSVVGGLWLLWWLGFNLSVAVAVASSPLPAWRPRPAS